MKRAWVICIVVCVILLIIFALLIFRKSNYTDLENEKNRFQAVHSQHFDELTCFVHLLNSIKGEYSIIIHNKQLSFESGQMIEETNDRLLLDSVAKCAVGLFGDEVSIRKRVEHGSSIIVIDKTIDISRNPFTHSWVSTSLWYCDDPSSQAMQQQIQMHEDTMIRLDAYFTLITVGLV